ncbi:MAG TPA: PilC/PilY family type IV pilus protein, partial [Telluria sp.]
MKIRILLALALLAAGQTAQSGPVNIAQVPLLNITGTGSVKPNLMLLYDNSGSMASNYTPDYVDDNSTCRSRATMSGGVTSCSPGHPPFNSPDFNKQYYNPKISYTPPVKADGTSYPSMTSAQTGGWTAVSTDGFGINTKDMLGNSASTSNLVTNFPDKKWCLSGSSSSCNYNLASYAYPNDTYYASSNINTNPYYYTIHAAEYCTDTSGTTCQTVAVGAPAPAGYPEPFKVRWCDSRALTNCQAKFMGTFKYPRFSSPNSGVLASYGTITVDSSETSTDLTVTSVTVGESGGNVVISNGPVTADGGTNSTTKQATLASLLAASIHAKTGLANQYTACVRTPTPSGSAIACSSLGITLGANNVVAVVPLSCPTAGSAKSQCSVLGDSSRAGWPISAVTPAVTTPNYPATGIVTVTGTTASRSDASLSVLRVNGVNLFSSTLVFGRSDSASEVAAAIRAKIGTQGTIRAYIGGDPVSPACDALYSNSVCIVDTAAESLSVSVSSTLTNNSKGSTRLSSSSADRQPATTDSIPLTFAPLAAGSAVFVRTDIVPTRVSYPKEVTRTDCTTVAGSCTYDEEMTNFANWYAYYKTRNQMMKTAVGRAFQPITGNFRVGIVSLSTAAAEGAMTVPRDFTGAARTDWYTKLYAMNGSSYTPLRPALHAVGKMYANRSPYNYAAGSEVVQFPCQQNFTFMTTDGYWNGSAASDVTSNDNVENLTRFCSQLTGCVDPRTQSLNSLADVALYWYNGGSNTGTASLRPSLEDYSKAAGMVPAGAGENTRLHMNTYTLGLGVDGIMTYEPNYDKGGRPGGDFYKLVTGASGCPWNGGGRYVWPDPVTGDDSTSAYQSRVDDLWHAAINGHGKYFSASDPLQVVSGLNSALNNIQVRLGAAAAAATSTPNISQQDNDIFSDTFTTVKWYGELTDRKIDTVTGIVGSQIVWTTTDQLGRQVGSDTDSRVIKMRNLADGSLKDFRYDLLTDQEKSWFDGKCTQLSQCSALSLADRAIVNDGENVVNWLRGQQQHANDTIFRAYAMTQHTPAGAAGPIPIVLGDIASAKPAYLREPRKGYSLAGYSDYKVAHANRQPTVFAAANDGMLHAFAAGANDSGHEMWAYAPRITMSKLFKQTSTTYGTNHQFTVDGSPEVADVEINGEWRTVLVAGLNAGGRGYYALDVTDPTAPVPLWEICADTSVCPSGDARYGELGLTFGNPQFGKWTHNGVSKWVVLVTSGYNNIPGTDGVSTGTGEGFLFVLDVATGAILERIGTGSGDTGTPSGFAKITAITANPVTDPTITHVYGGDNQGQMWRFDMTGTTILKTMMGTTGVTQPITTRPEVTLCQMDTVDAAGNVTASDAKKVVLFGTGRLLDVPDVSNTDLQSLYAIKDSDAELGNLRATGASLVEQQLGLVAGGSTPVYTVTNNDVGNFAQA